MLSGAGVCRRMIDFAAVRAAHATPYEVQAWAVLWEPLLLQGVQLL